MVGILAAEPPLFYRVSYVESQVRHQWNWAIRLVRAKKAGKYVRLGVPGRFLVWRSDFNNDGFDWGASTTPFRYGGVAYSSLAAFSAASGLETNGRLINRTTCFATFTVPGPAPLPIPPQFMTLNAGWGAVDAGAIFPNINDGFAGAAPDLGAFEFGRPLPTYGPRLATPPIAPTNLRIVR